jgi:hypothetical protein
VEIGEVRDPEPDKLAGEPRERTVERLETDPAGLEMAPGEPCRREGRPGADGAP